MNISEDLKRAESVAAGMRRGLNVQPISWDELLAIAQQEIGAHQQRDTLRVSQELYQEENASGLIAAARIAEDLAYRNFQSADFASFELERFDAFDLDKEERLLLVILASCAFGMYGNFPSAAAVQKRINILHLSTEGQLLAVAMTNPRQIAAALTSRLLTNKGREFLEQLNLFILTGDETASRDLISQFESLMTFRRPPSDVTFLRCARLALKHIVTLAVSNLFQQSHSDVFSGFLSNVIEEGRPCLLPPQYTLIYNQRLLASSANAVITIPTSTGKTLLGELAIAARLTNVGDIGLYVTPYIALGRQVHEAFSGHAPDGVSVRGYFGNFNSHVEPINPWAKTIIVGTPERIDGLLRAHDLYSRIRTVVFDEAHGIENGSRGARLESLVTRFRLQQRRHQDLRIILLSAVLNEVDSIKAWLGADTLHLHDTWRPTARRLGVWQQNGQLAWLWGTDPLKPNDQKATQMIGMKALPWPELMRPAEKIGVIQVLKPVAYRNAAYLARYLNDSIGGPLLIACSSKANTRGVATAIANSIDLDEQVTPARKVLADSIVQSHPHLRALGDMIRKGVAFHNASLPGKVRSDIEDAIKDKTLNYIAATTTLAEGVDLPFRVTVLFDWLFGAGASVAPMGSLLFRNIAGRCGRAGEFTEGDTIIFDNVLGDLSFTANDRRHRFQALLFRDPPPVQSSIANDNLARETQSAVGAIVSSQLLASIPENPDVDNLDAVWANATYSAYRGGKPQELLKAIRVELLSGQNGEPFAKAASPMQLTEFGTAANRTGFGPTTCRQILRALDEIDFTTSFPQIAGNILERFGACDEQTNYLLRDIANRKATTFYVKADDLEGIASGWLEGKRVTEMFLALPRAKKSKAAISPERWIAGEADHEPIAAQYDKFIDLVEYSFGGFLPWLLRAMGALAPFSSKPDVIMDWDAVAKLFEAAKMADVGAIDEIANRDQASES